jgi:hypothetical protein
VARSSRRVQPSPNLWRAAVELLGALVLAGAVLFAPFVYAAYRLNRAERVPSARAAQIAHANCAQLRHMGIDGSALSVMLFPIPAERASREQDLILRRGKELHCRPAIQPIYTSD